MSTNEESAAHFYMKISDNLGGSLNMLMPLSGFDKMPLVSLQEALEPISAMLPSIQNYAWSAKHGCTPNPSDDLTADESASIILHSMVWEPYEQCLHFILNDTLCKQDRQTLKPWFPYLKLLLTALWKLPSSRQIVYRGVKSDLSLQYSRGEQFTWCGFSSCVLSLDVLENEQFLGKSSARTIFMIECENGKDIRQHSYHKSQAEILLLPGTYLKVCDSLNMANGLHVIHLKEIDPPFQLLAPPISLASAMPSPKVAMAQYAGMGVHFVDVSNDAGLKRVTWSKHAPAWRRAIRGICLEGTCTTTTCEAYSKQVVIGIGQRKFDLVLDSNASNCQCPMCHEYVEPIKCSFNNCDWRWSGIKQLPGKAPEKCSSGDGWLYADDAYHYFDESVSGQVVWRQLLFEAREHQ